MGKGEKILIGFIFKRFRIGKVKVFNIDTIIDKENIGIEGDINILFSFNKFIKMVEGGKLKVVICKDLISRGGCYDME